MTSKLIVAGTAAASLACAAIAYLSRRGSLAKHSKAEVLALALQDNEEKVSFVLARFAVALSSSARVPLRVYL
jgi:hypothetical protein